MSPEIENAYNYCRGVTKTHAKSFFFAAKFLPPAKQRAVFPIYAFCRHVDDEIDELGDSGPEDLAIAAVGRWQANLESVYAAATGGNPEKIAGAGSAELSLVMTAWTDLLANYRIPQKLPLELVQGVLMDTTTNRYETFDELYVYCYRVASTVGLMSSEILGYSDPAALGFAEAMGIGMQLTNILRDIQDDARRGRIYLPQQDLRRFGVTEQQILDGVFNSQFRKLMEFQVARARDYYRDGERGIAMLEKDSRFTVLLASRIYSKILDEIEKQNYNVFIRRAHTTNTQKILALPGIWRASRKI